MIIRNFKQIVAMLSSTVVSAVEMEENATINGVSIDTRTMQAGNLFIPIIGENFDGHSFVDQAFQQGAKAALWQADRGEPPAGRAIIVVTDTVQALQQLAQSYLAELSVRIIAVTGSNGKTTTKDFIASILSTTYRTLKTEGNLNNHLGLPLSLLKLESNHQMAVLEMGMSERGEIELLSTIAKPEVAVITNIGEAHLMQLGSREGIAEAKLEIVSGLRQDGLLIYNGDEPLLANKIAERQHEGLESGWKDEMKVFRFGMTKTNDYYPTGIMTDQAGTHFTLNENRMPAYYIPILGTHNVSNALAAIAVAKYMGVREQDIVTGLRTAQISSMRAEISRGSNGVTIINDAYNASPTSMKAAIHLLEDMKGYNRKIIVLGDMLELGELERHYHEEIGRLLDPERIDQVFTYGESAAFIAEQASENFPSHRLHSQLSKQEIAEQIIASTNADDIVLLKASRGLKFEEIVDDLTYDNNHHDGGVN